MQPFIGSTNLNELANKKPLKKFSINPMFVRSSCEKEKYKMIFSHHSAHL